MRVIESAFQVISELPGAFSAWATGLNDATFARVMILGVVVLTFVIARALR